MPRNYMDLIKGDSKKQEKKGDRIMVVFFLTIAIICLLLSYLRQKQGQNVQITVDGEVVACYALDTDREIPLEGDGWHNTLVIKDGKADMVSADCPDLICVDHRPISHQKETIVCLPHKLVAEIIGQTEEVTVDAIAQ